LLNPIGGTRQATKIFENIVKPMLEKSETEYDLRG